MPRFELMSKLCNFTEFSLFCSYFNMLFPGCSSFFSFVFYGTVMNNHKVPWGYSIIRKKILNSYLTAKELRKGVPGTTIYSSMFYFFTYWEDTTIAEDTQLPHFRVFFLVFTVLLLLPLFVLLPLRLAMFSNFIFT